jgi:uroporphyrinogen decarboxylase
MAMDPAQLKDRFGDRLSFWGSICIQQTLPRGSREDIFNEVRLRIQTIGRGGGLIIGPAHNIQADTSVDNILAFYEAAKQNGTEIYI